MSSRLIWIALVLHTLYIVNTLLTPSPNLFTALSIPVNSPTDAIRAALQRSAQVPLPDYLNALLLRLDSFELRSLYIRFGHNVVLTCEHCGTMEDYALYALPRPALAYLREIALVGLVTLEKLNHSHLRSLGVGILVGAFLTEAYCLGTAPIAIPPPNVRTRAEDIYMWHDQLLLYRRALFLILPIILSIFPSVLAHVVYSPTLYPAFIRIPLISFFVRPPLPLASLHMLGLRPQSADNMSPAKLRPLLIQSCLRTLEHLTPATSLQKLTHAAIMRNKELRTRASKWWDGEKEDADAILNDEGVKNAARAEGLAFEDVVKPEWSGGADDGQPEIQEGQLRISARMAVDGLFRQGIMPSEYWVARRLQ